MMTTQQIAAQYQEMMNQRKFVEIQDNLYHEDVVCQEPEKAAALGFAIITNGREAIKAKGVARRATIETFHSYECSTPLVAGEYFTVTLRQEITFKTGVRTGLEEIGVFQVKDGQIIKEQFFF